MKKILPLALLGLVIYAVVYASKNETITEPNNSTPGRSGAGTPTQIVQGRAGAAAPSTVVQGRTGAKIPNTTTVTYGATYNPSTFTMPADVGVGRLPNPIN